MKRIWRWIFFGVALGIAPLLTSGMIQATRGQNVNLNQLLAHGELLLITVGICGAAIGELTSSGGNWPSSKIIAAGSTTVILVIASLYFSDVSAANSSGVSLETDIIKITSVFLFVFALVSSGTCVAFSGD